MTHAVIIGCGVVGAAIAYELSAIPGLRVTVCDRQLPAQGSTGAALGVLVGIISQKVKGKAWMLRQTSLRRYDALIAELEALTGRSIPYNRQGLINLYFDADQRRRWEQVIAIRQAQGWVLQHWNRDELQGRCPHIDHPHLQGAIYSPQDRQVDPTALTLALVEAAQQRGVDFHWNRAVQGLQSAGSERQHCVGIETDDGAIAADWVILSAGLGTPPLTQAASQLIDIRPVLGQALRIHLDQPLGQGEFQAVVSGEDIHIVPVGDGDYWVGATVEFPSESESASEAMVADPERLESLLQGAIAFCPALAQGQIVQTWSGLRPRPFNRPAPIIELLAGYDNVWVATGHYRNGILLAPATALAIKELLMAHG